MPVNHTIMQCTNQIANRNNNTRYNMSYDGCDVIYVVCLACGYASSARVLHKSWGRKKLGIESSRGRGTAEFFEPLT